MTANGHATGSKTRVTANGHAGPRDGQTNASAIVETANGHSESASELDETVSGHFAHTTESFRHRLICPRIVVISPTVWSHFAHNLQTNRILFFYT